MDNTEKYKKLFLIEAEEKIAALNTAFLGLEKKPGSSALANDAMRASHTLKSSAAAMNYMNISHLCHTMEDVFSAIGGEEARSKKHPLTPAAIEILFAAVDTLSSAVEAIKKGKPEPDTKKMIEKLQEIIEGGRGQGSQPIADQLPAGAKSSSASLREAGQAGGEEGAALAQKPEGNAPIEAIKVDIATLDKIMNLTEELLVEKMRLSEIVRHIKEKPDDKLASAELEGSSESFDRLISELQLNVTQARMVPLGQIFERFPRMMRDLAHSLNKEVDFDITGQDIELDRTVIDRLGEPLIHLLRNAVDHGIDKKGKVHLTALRERDKVIIEVSNSGKPIDWQKVIEIAQSRGVIDKATRDRYQAQIKNFSVQGGSQPKADQPLAGAKISGGEISKYKSEIEDLLYHVSTKEKVTETSGRGVGLSIVKSVTESFGGKVTLESSNAEEGTKFRLQLPLTIAIIQALLVRVVNQTFAIPLVQIERSVRVSSQNIKKALDQEVAVVEDEDIPMVRLGKLFGITKKRLGLFLSEEEIEKGRNLQQAELMVIAKRESSNGGVVSNRANLAFVGLMVDELISKQDIVVKPLKGMLRQAKGFAGITLLGDGRPALILDLATLI